MQEKIEKEKEIIVQRKINELRAKGYGEIIIKMHNGRIVDIRMTEIEKWFIHNASSL